jgi:hypothetical protein
MSDLNNQLPTLQYFERYRNEGTRTYSDHSAYTEAELEYRPDSTHAGFELPVFRVPADQVHVYSANPSEELKTKYVGGAEAMVCIHPQFLSLCPNDIYLRRTREVCTSEVGIPVIPSSSTRTLYVDITGVPHALKVHFPFKVSRYTRKMRAEVIEQAVNVSRELEAGVHQLDEDFAFLREVIGIAHRNLEPESPRGENWGYLIRDMTPFPHRDSEHSLVPGFALYGKDYFDPGTPPFLFDLIKERDPVEFVLEQIMLPVIRHWVGCFRKFGYLLEPHGQNVILALGGDRSIRRIVHRDLSVGIDMRRRTEVGLSEKGFNEYNRVETKAFHSITYDRFMGGHFFDRLVRECQERYPQIARADFADPCREEFARLFPDSMNYFPETVWYFSEERDEYNKPLFQDTGTRPEWRPS